MLFPTKHAIFLIMFVGATLASADTVGRLNIHKAPGGKTVTGHDNGRSIPVEIDFSQTQDGTYDVTVWSGEREIGEGTRVYVRDGKVGQVEGSYPSNLITIHCPATASQQNRPTSFQIFVQAELDDTQKGGRVLIDEARWEVGSVEDGQPGKTVEPRKVVCSAGSNLDIHGTGSFDLQNQSDNSVTATLIFGGRKYGNYSLHGHSDEKIRADAWGINPGIGWYVTTPNANSPGGRKIQAAGSIYNTEGGNDAGFTAVPLNDQGPAPSSGPAASATTK
ncbi:MAG: hypothetical protein JO076_06130 [Verrucomicrobia bacterium]|nr:hypothetical protein [Verrucomicrobiota bacterium]